MPDVTPGNTYKLTRSNALAQPLAAQGVRPPSRTRTPDKAQLILVELQLLSLSVSFIDAVASTIIATLYWATAAPLIEAVALAVSCTDGKPNSLRKYVGTLTCCLTWTAFPFAGATHGIPWPVRVDKHFT